MFLLKKPDPNLKQLFKTEYLYNRCILPRKKHKKKAEYVTCTFSPDEGFSSLLFGLLRSGSLGGDLALLGFEGSGFGHIHPPLSFPAGGFGGVGEVVEFFGGYRFVEFFGGLFSGGFSPEEIGGFPPEETGGGGLGSEYIRVLLALGIFIFIFLCFYKFFTYQEVLV
ncbi:hypothetical protein BY996DRAFT_7274715 [Phakopsora pachyrhizi]|nr:hypothetical protein BY996DRAFT_7274715 [Phakopsora pachyrhizi]